MKQILKYIYEHLKENISLKQISDIAGYSEFHFSRMFKKSTGSTLQAYIIKRRLIKSSEDIVNGKRIIDVALEYGWESHSGFTKSFKKEFGFSPSLLKALIIEIDGLGGNSMGHVFLESAEIGIGKERLFDILCELLEKNN